MTPAACAALRAREQRVEEDRDIPFGNVGVDPGRDAHAGRKASAFPLNAIRTSKYTPLTFVPRNTLEQLRKVANVYFVILSSLMFLSLTGLYVSALNGQNTLGVLLILMSVTAFMDARDDYRRHRADRQINTQKAKRICMGGKHGFHVDTVGWEAVAVGDVLAVKGDEEFPADLVALASAGAEGACYVSTANLDGETNLKLKTAVASTQAALSDRCADAVADVPLLELSAMRLSRLTGRVRAEPASRSIHTFSGGLRLDGVEEEETLVADNFLLRGTWLRNTAWCIGVVVYTGPDARIVRNAGSTPAKLANVDRIVNRGMVVVVGFQVLLALVSDVMREANKREIRSLEYLYPNNATKATGLPEWLAYFITFFILYSNLMPISLYAGMEVVNQFQAYFIKQDLSMYDEEQDFPAAARASNLCHELGQVSYLFSDKTGTLTQNIMDLKRVSLAGRAFGQVGEERGFNGAAEVWQAQLEDPAVREHAAAFLEVLAVAHTVLVTRDRHGARHLEAESPDEGALVEAAQALGWDLQDRIGRELTVEVEGVGRQQYIALAVNAFTSSRKRMSVVVRNPRGELWLLAKGADNVMLERAANQDQTLQGYIDEFAQDGLRTLVFGRRRIQENEFAAWRAEHEQALRATGDRQDRLDACAERLEVELELVGATGIEDKLQEGVPDTIVRIQRAGIKLWVLTGDKLETARNIGFSTNVLSDKMDVLVLDLPRGTSTAALGASLADAEAAIEAASAGHRKTGMLVTGASLEQLAEANLSEEFLRVTTQCEVLIACRVSPLQKAWMVALVRASITPRPVTLAIGDGANDVPMIQAAQVGVAIAGREGRQAVCAADFAIGKFRFLERLLLVHGRWNYQRMAKVILYSFWNKALLIMLLFFYQFDCGYSGASMFEDLTRMSYNIIIFWPIILTGIFDREVEDVTAIANPNLYESSRLGSDLGTNKICLTLLSAVAHSALILAAVHLTFDESSPFMDNGYYVTGTTIFTWVLISANLRYLLVTKTFNWIIGVGFLLSYLSYGIFLSVYCRLPLQPWMHNVDLLMLQSPKFWTGALVVPAFAITVDVFSIWVTQDLLPDRTSLVYEVVSRRGWHGSRDPRVRPGWLAMAPRRSRRRRALGRQRAFLSSRSPSKADSAADYPQRSSGSVDFASRPDPLANDTTLLDSPAAAAGVPAAAGEAELAGRGARPAASGRPRDSRFGQQRLPSFQLVVSWRVAILTCVVTGCFSLLCALLLWITAGSCVPITYDRDGGPLSSSADGVHCHQLACPVNSSCTCSLTLDRDLTPPIAAIYVVNPFYQNELRYMNAVIPDELVGHRVSKTRRSQVCRRDAKGDLIFPCKDAEGDDIFPCGMIATSVFNDTFSIDDVDINTDFTHDLRLDFQNPADYNTRTNVSWLSDRYPGVIGEEGVESSRFISWMYPSFFSKVAKVYGYIHQPLVKGQTLTLRIGANFNVTSSLGARARKQFLLSDGHSASVAKVPLAAGVACLAMSATIGMIQGLCPRRVGKVRFTKFSIPGIYARPTMSCLHDSPTTARE